MNTEICLQYPPDSIKKMVSLISLIPLALAFAYFGTKYIILEPNDVFRLLGFKLNHQKYDLIIGCPLLCFCLIFNIEV